MERILRVFWIAAFGLAACNGGASPNEAGSDARDAANDVVADGGADVPTDVPPNSGIVLFGRCARSSDCAAAGAHAMCLTDWPGGLCSIPCTTDRMCGTNGLCVGGMGCVPSCMQSAGDLRCDPYGSICLDTSNDPANPAPGCFPSCFVSGAPSGVPSCPAALACDPWSGTCDGMPPPDGPTGTDNGDPCMTDTDCKSGRCAAEVDQTSGDPTGNIGGYCYSVGRLPDPNTAFSGSMIPQANCPPGSVIVDDGSGLQTVGDPGTCLRACMTDHDCRAGYFCDHMTNSSGTPFTNGVCNPIDCTLPARTCPAGYACLVPDAAMSTGTCAATGDAGTTDAGGSDAATDAGTETGTDAGLLDVVLDVPLGG